MRRTGLSESELSRQVGRSRAWLNNVITRGAWPNAADCHKMTQLLNCSFEDLFVAGVGNSRKREASEILSSRVAAVERERNYNRPEVLDLINWHIENNGVLKNFDGFADYVEIFERPDVDSLMVNAIWLGRYTLSAIEMGLGHPDDLKELMYLSEETDRQEIVQAHNRVFENWKIDLTTRTLSINYCEGFQVNIDYVRLIIPVFDPNNHRKVIINFSSSLRCKELRTKEIQNF